MALKKYNNLLISRRCLNKNTKDAHILALVGVTQMLSHDSKESANKSNTYNRESTKGYPTYISYLPP